MVPRLRINLKHSEIKDADSGTGLFLRCLPAGPGHQADDRQFPVGLVLVLGEMERGGAASPGDHPCQATGAHCR